MDRVRRGLRRYGARGALRRGTEIARGAVYAQNVHVWYQLPLRPERPRFALDAELSLVRASRNQAALLDDLWTLDRGEAERRLDDGATLWLVLHGERPAFSCWTFRRRAPVSAARGGWLALPNDTACLEESMTAEAFRGRGVAPAAWTAIADELERDGELRRMVTKVEEENVASRRAVEKVGFREVARMTETRVGPRVRVAISGDGGDDVQFLAGVER